RPPGDHLVEFDRRVHSGTSAEPGGTPSAVDVARPGVPLPVELFDLRAGPRTDPAVEGVGGGDLRRIGVELPSTLHPEQVDPGRARGELAHPVRGGERGPRDLEPATDLFGGLPGPGPGGVAVRAVVV